MEKRPPSCLYVLVALCCVLGTKSVAGDAGTCGAKCLKDEGCEGALACMHNSCGDDPSMHTNICSAGASDSSGKDSKKSSSNNKEGGGNSSSNGDQDKPASEEDDSKSEKKYSSGDIMQDVTEYASKGGNLAKLHSLFQKLVAKLKGGKQEANTAPIPPASSPLPPPSPSTGGGGECKAKSELKGTGGKCNKDNNAECCESGKSYPLYDCSPPVTQQTPAILTLNSFQAGGDGGGASECDDKFHSNSQLVVALSTGWFNHKKSCGATIRIVAHTGKSADAVVVDECDSMHGCDKDHDFQPACRNNVVDASEAVWDKLGISKGSSDYGETNITWSFVSSSQAKS